MDSLLNFIRPKKFNLVDNQTIEDLRIDDLVAQSLKVRHPSDTDEVTSFFRKIPDATTAGLRSQLFQKALSDPQLLEQIRDLEKRLYAVREVEFSIRAVRDSNEMVSLVRKTVLELSRANAALECIIYLKTTRWSEMGIPILADIGQITSEFVSNEELKEGMAQISKARFRLNRIKSLKLGIGLNQDLVPESVGLLEVSDQPIRQTSLLNRVLGKPSGDTTNNLMFLFATGVSDKHKAKREGMVKVPNEDGVYIDGRMRPLFDQLGILEKSLFKSINLDLADVTQNTVEQMLKLSTLVTAFVNIIQVIEFWKTNSKELNFVALSEHEATKISQLRNPLLALGEDHSVSSNLDLPVSSTSIITGPNSGGKTTFLTAIGINALLANLGLPIFAGSGKMAQFSNIVTHFQMEEKGLEKKGRLEEELTRLKGLLKKCDRHTLILMNETFSSTDSFEATKLAEIVLATLKKKGATSLFVTHLHQLYEKLQAHDDVNVSLKSFICKPNNPFEFFESEPESNSFALKAAEKYELDCV